MNESEFFWEIYLIKRPITGMKISFCINKCDTQCSIDCFIVLIPEVGDHLEAILVCAERSAAALL